MRVFVYAVVIWPLFTLYAPQLQTLNPLIALPVHIGICIRLIKACSSVELMKPQSAKYSLALFHYSVFILSVWNTTLLLISRLSQLFVYSWKLRPLICVICCVCYKKHIQDVLKTRPAVMQHWSIGNEHIVFRECNQGWLPLAFFFF